MVPAPVLTGKSYDKCLHWVKFDSKLRQPNFWVLQLADCFFSFFRTSLAALTYCNRAECISDLAKSFMVKEARHLILASEVTLTEISTHSIHMIRRTLICQICEGPHPTDWFCQKYGSVKSRSILLKFLSALPNVKSSLQRPRPFVLEIYWLLIPLLD